MARSTPKKSCFRKKEEEDEEEDDEQEEQEKEQVVQGWNQGYAEREAVIIKEISTINASCSELEPWEGEFKVRPPPR